VTNSADLPANVPTRRLTVLPGVTVLHHRPNGTASFPVLPAALSTYHFVVSARTSRARTSNRHEEQMVCSDQSDPACLPHEKVTQRVTRGGSIFKKGMTMNSISEPALSRAR